MSTCQLAMFPCDIVGDSAGIVSSCIHLLRVDPRGQIDM